MIISHKSKINSIRVLSEQISVNRISGHQIIFEHVLIMLNC